MMFPIKEVLNNAGHSSKDYSFNYRQVSYATSFQRDLKFYTTFRMYMKIFSLIQFGIHDPWLLLSCVGGYQKVTSLSRH
jgi:hypothetical protein